MPDHRNEIFYDQDFLKDVRHFPIKTQGKLSELIEILREDAFDKHLHTKPLSAPLQGFFLSVLLEIIASLLNFVAFT